jgi:hypothetical protein
MTKRTEEERFFRFSSLIFFERDPFQGLPEKMHTGIGRAFW